MKITRKQLRRLIESTLNEYTTDPAAATTWQSYVTKTNNSHGNDLGKKVMDGWAELVDKGIIDASDQNFKSWVKWYRSQTEDETIMGLVGKQTGKHLSPQEVIDVYNRLIGLYAAENNVPEAPEIFVGMTEEEAQKIADDFNNAMEKETDEKKKSRLRKGYEWVRDNTGKEARQKRRAARKEKRAGERGDVEDPRIKPTDNDSEQSSGNKITYEGIEFVPNKHSRSELESMAKQLQQKNPKKYAYFIGGYGEGQTYAKNDLRNANPDNPPENIGITVIPVKDRQLQALTIAINKSLNESLSRGSLYRRRYRRY